MRRPHNGDGFGIGYYTRPALGPEPCIFTSTIPAWNCINLERLASKTTSALIFAHVRATTEGALADSNCHPFRRGRLMFMHNGNIGAWRHVKRALAAALGDRWFLGVQGGTDSEWAFALFLDTLERMGHDPDALDGGTAAAAAGDTASMDAASRASSSSDSRNSSGGNNGGDIGEGGGGNGNGNGNGNGAGGGGGGDGGFGHAVLREAMLETIRRINSFIASIPAEVRAREGEALDTRSLLNFAVTDGQSVVCTRYVSSRTDEAASLFFSSGTSWREHLPPGRYMMERRDKGADIVLVASEPLTFERGMLYLFRFLSFFFFYINFVWGVGSLPLFLSLFLPLLRLLPNPSSQNIHKRPG